MASWQRLVEVGREVGPDPELAEVTDEALVAMVRSQAATVARETARWVVLVAELVVRGTWADQGAKNPGQWLSLMVGMAPTTARDHVRVGLALRDLPKMRRAFLAGQVSYSKVRAMTRLGHRETEDVLLEWADAASAAELEQIVTWTRRSCRVDGVEAEPFADDPTDETSAASRVERTDWLTRDDGSVEVRLRMDEADAARLRAKLQWLASRGDAGIPVEARIIQGLLEAVDLAAAACPDESGQDRDCLVVAVEATMLDDSAESPRLRLLPQRTAGPGPAMGVRTLRRLACTAGVVPLLTRDGSPLDVGRTQRRATARQRRALAVRDPDCRFPGCTSSQNLQAHHALEWDADDGPTNLDNLLHLCGFHHRFLHRAGWRVRPDGQGEFTFLDAVGNVFDRPWRDSAESPGVRVPAFVAALDDGRGLQPRHWDGSHDLDLCVAVLRNHLDRRLTGQERRLAVAA